MSKFITRVELHHGTGDDYEELHTAMARAGFSRTIQGRDGITYHLPWAEYHVDTTSTIEQVRSAVLAASKMTGRTAAVLVSQASQIAWQGLSRVG
jgi:hypothetical protein